LLDCRRSRLLHHPYPVPGCQWLYLSSCCPHIPAQLSVLPRAA
jgi:hypothetical protein